jgi:hypothetical protein
MEIEELTYEDFKKIRRKRKLTEIETETWTRLRKEALREQKRVYYQKTKEREEPAEKYTKSNIVQKTVIKEENTKSST